MWVGNIQMAESPNRTKRQKKKGKLVYYLFYNWNALLLPLDLRTPSRFSGLWILGLALAVPGCQAFGHGLRLSSPASLVLRLSDLNWAMLLAFLVFHLTYGLSWDFSAFIIKWVHSPNKPPLIFHYVSYRFYFSGEPWLKHQLCYTINSAPSCLAPKARHPWSYFSNLHSKSIFLVNALWWRTTPVLEKVVFITHLSTGSLASFSKRMLEMICRIWALVG